MRKSTQASGLLGDTPARNYAQKLTLFNAFAAPELRQAIARLDLRPGMRVLDVGCGTGEALGWFSTEVAQEGIVIGMDLASAHLTFAHARIKPGTFLVQGNLSSTPFTAASFDLIWSVNTINHVRDPNTSIRGLAALLRTGGRLALGQSSLLPDMYFAWDARLEKVTNEAVRHYYRDRYQLSEYDLAAVRAIVGRLRQAGLRNVRAHSFLIERVAPVNEADERYLVEAIFRDTWGVRLQPYLSSGDYQELMRLCDPQHADFALHRPDFHFLQSFTLAIAETA